MRVTGQGINGRYVISQGSGNHQSHDDRTSISSSQQPAGVSENVFLAYLRIGQFVWTQCGDDVVESQGCGVLIRTTLFSYVKRVEHCHRLGWSEPETEVKFLFDTMVWRELSSDRRQAAEFLLEDRTQDKLKQVNTGIWRGGSRLWFFVDCCDRKLLVTVIFAGYLSLRAYCKCRDTKIPQNKKVCWFDMREMFPKRTPGSWDLASWAKTIWLTSAWMSR